MTFYCNYVVKRVGKITRSASQFPTVLHTDSQSFALSRNFSETSQTLQLRYTECDYEHPEIRKPIGLVERDSILKNLSKSNSTDVAEKIKPVYNTNCSQKNNLKSRIQTSVPKFFAMKKSFLARQKTYNRDTKLKRYTGEHLPI